MEGEEAEHEKKAGLRPVTAAQKVVNNRYSARESNLRLSWHDDFFVHSEHTRCGVGRTSRSSTALFAPGNALVETLV